MAKRPRKSSGRIASKGFPNPIDVHLGARIRLRRTLLGISQTTLADALGLTFQQVQKYERGGNRVSSSRLVDMANALEVPIPYFFEEMSAEVGAQTPSALIKAGRRPIVAGNETDLLAKRETLEFVRAYYRITDPAVRKRLADLTKIMAKSAEQAEKDRAIALGIGCVAIGSPMEPSRPWWQEQQCTPKGRKRSHRRTTK